MAITANVDLGNGVSASSCYIIVPTAYVKKFSDDSFKLISDLMKEFSSIFSISDRRFLNKFSGMRVSYQQQVFAIILCNHSLHNRHYQSIQVTTKLQNVDFCLHK